VFAALLLRGHIFELAQLPAQIGLEMVRPFVFGHHRQHPLKCQNLLLIGYGTAKPLLSLKIFRCKISRHLLKSKIKNKSAKLQSKILKDIKCHCEEAPFLLSQESRGPTKQSRPFAKQRLPRPHVVRARNDILHFDFSYFFSTRPLSLRLSHLPRLSNIPFALPAGFLACWQLQT